ncbi:unnamed protein product [Prorocentrum cordatum]|uniref:Uncharacterized protein n=1 Tax=Prorocentrum cordatum TaxID=2364126 RepID=A0ABN9SZL9_9DINO|nr:unnamed protein product [Polarella glacialis]
MEEAGAAELLESMVNPDTIPFPMGATIRHSYHTTLENSVAHCTITANEGDEVSYNQALDIQKEITTAKDSACKFLDKPNDYVNQLRP